MDLAFSLAQLIFPAFRFGETDPAEAERLVDLGVGGFCLYWGKAEEVRDFTSRMQKKSKSPLLFCADYEDGVGQWVDRGTKFPSNMAVGAAGSEEFAFKKAVATAREAKALGVHWIYAPVVDLATYPDNPIVNIRAFGNSPENVERLAGAYLKGLRSEGVVGCLKHFPGHGESRQDSHLELPTLDLTREEVEEREARPYKILRETADSIMLGHLKVPSLDLDKPTSLSEKVISGFLRGDLKYEGVVVTDALSMKSVSDNSEAGVQALQAGADVLLVPEDSFKLHRVLLEGVDAVKISRKRVEAALKRIENLKTRVSRSRETDLTLLNCPEHVRWAQEMAQAAVSWVRKPSRVLIKPGDTLFYLEPGAESESDRQGEIFVKELQQAGIHVKFWTPDSQLATPNWLLVGIFSKPQAYSGAINLSSESRKMIQSALAKSKNRIVLSWGSPFVFSGLDFEAGLCTFSDLEVSQGAAARVLLGKLKAEGKWPV
ncbi:MAG: hypothetical protein HY400_06620 [Elusimicrobia bacterium]|nr:hypothetical protein [Elusimicrobiota bacterium]